MYRRLSLKKELHKSMLLFAVQIMLCSKDNLKRNVMRDFVGIPQCLPPIISIILELNENMNMLIRQYLPKKKTSMT